MRMHTHTHTYTQHATPRPAPAANTTKRLNAPCLSANEPNRSSASHTVLRQYYRSITPGFKVNSLRNSPLPLISLSSSTRYHAISETSDAIYWKDRQVRSFPLHTYMVSVQMGIGGI
jgi:hypothetical protein